MSTEHSSSRRWAPAALTYLQLALPMTALMGGCSHAPAAQAEAPAQASRTAATPAEWAQQLQDAINPLWQIPAGTDDLMAIAMFRVGPEGEVQPRIVRPSGNAQFDQSILDAALRAKPLPAPRDGVTFTPPTVGICFAPRDATCVSLPSGRMEDLHSAFDRNRAALLSLYNNAVRDRSIAAGEIKLHLTITPGGMVTECTVASSTINDKAFEQRLVEKVKHFQLPARDVPQFVIPGYRIDFPDPPANPPMSWIDRIGAAIHRAWALPPGLPKDLRCKVRITLTPEGTVERAEILIPSGNDAFDNSILLAVRKAQPLPVPEEPSQLQLLTFTFVPSAP